MATLAQSVNPLPLLCGTSEANFQSKLLALEGLVTIDRLKAHLTLLEAFRRIIAEDIGDPLNFDPHADHVVLTPQARKYFHSAVDRFLAWTHTLVDGFVDTNFVPPPPDVLMVWHAFVLNPRNIYEDSHIRMPHLSQLLAFPLELVVYHIDPTTNKFMPPPEFVLKWESVMNCAYDTVHPHPTLPRLPKPHFSQCPQCDTSLDQVDIQKRCAATDGDYNDVLAVCSHCNLSITKNTLCVKKFMTDLALYAQIGTPLPGTILDRAGGIDVNRGRVIADEIIRLLGEPDSVGKCLGWTISHVENKLQAQSSPVLRSSRIKDLLAPYRYLPPFSVDLNKSVISQSYFTTMINSSGISAQGTPDGTLYDSVTRYHKFLEILTIPGVGRLSPTLDIDLVWHTHQLEVLRYRSHMLTLVGNYIHHDDAVNSTDRETAKTQSSVLWEMYFGDCIEACRGPGGPGSPGKPKPDGPKPDKPEKPKPPPTKCTSGTQDFNEMDLIYLEVDVKQSSEN